MAKILFSTVLFFSLGVFSQNTKTTLKESFLPDYVAQKEKADVDNIRRIVIKKDKSFKKGVVLLYNSMSCGVGLCTNYAFIKNAAGSFDFAGMIDGNFSESKEVKNEDLPEILTETRSPNDKPVKTKWLFSKDKKVYEAK